MDFFKKLFMFILAIFLVIFLAVILWFICDLNGVAAILISAGVVGGILLIVTRG